MPVHESSWLALAPRRGETLRAALERTLRDAIVQGALRVGSQLPGSRELAVQLGVSRGVVTDAYALLAAQGFLIVRPQRSPVVAPVGPRAARPADDTTPPRAPRWDLSPTSPDPTLFPTSRWLTALQRAAREHAPAALDYRESRGERRLRVALADHLGRTRGVVAEPAQIVVVQGTAQGLDLLLRLLARGRPARVAVEDPSHATQHERIRALGLELVAQPVDDSGLVIDGLDAEAVLVTPAHQFPTGRVLTSERRRQLLAWARQARAIVIEDDYDSEFRYDGEPVRALQGVAPGDVVLLGTVSKTLAPGLRLGWVVAPDALVDDVAAMKRLVDDFSPSLDQLAFADLLVTGEYDRHVRRVRSRYRVRRDRLIAALTAQLPELPVEGIAAGVHLLLRLPDETDDRELAAAAARAGIAVAALSSCAVRARTNGLVVGYGRLHEEAIRPAVRQLASVVRRAIA
jgi:GntR family transcriptional regulator / MocR family aminotransferase